MKPVTLGTVLLGAIIGITILVWPVLQKNSEETAALIISTDRPTGGEFNLQTSDGNIQLKDFSGKLTLIYFGYTFCPDICPTNLGNLSMAYQQLSQTEKEKLAILFISVDPERDTPERLNQYVSYFDMNAIGATADMQHITAISRNYGVVFAHHKENAEDDTYPVDHSAFTYIVDAQGNLQTQLPHATTPDGFIKAIRQYLP